jgi:hypothetical protein
MDNGGTVFVAWPYVARHDPAPDSRSFKRCACVICDLLVFAGMTDENIKIHSDSIRNIIKIAISRLLRSGLQAPSTKPPGGVARQNRSGRFRWRWRVIQDKPANPYAIDITI